MCQTFQTSIQRWPQFDSVIAAWEEQNPNVLTRDFLDFTTYLLTRYYNLTQDIKPRGGNAYSTRKGKGKHTKGKGRGRGCGKGKGKDTGKGCSLADNDYFEQPTKRPRLHERQAQSVEISELPDDSEDTMYHELRHSISIFTQTYAYTALTPPIRPRPVIPTPNRRSTTIAPTTAST
jgi:hypothetical protein